MVHWCVVYWRGVAWCGVVWCGVVNWSGVASKLVWCVAHSLSFYVTNQSQSQLSLALRLIEARLIELRLIEAD